MNIPNKVKIGAFEWEVQFNEHLMHERDERGCCKPKQLLIEIDPGTKKVAQEETFLHELLEAITWQYDIRMEHKDLWNLSVVLHQAIKENPNIFKQNEPMETVQVRDGFGKIIETRTKSEVIAANNAVESAKAFKEFIEKIKNNRGYIR